MAAFSFTGWNSRSITPKAAGQSQVATAPKSMVAPAGATLVGQVGAGQGPGNLPAWLSDAVSGLNSGSSLLTALQGLLGGAGQATPLYDPQIGAAALTDAQARYNAQVNQMNETSRLGNLVQQRNLLGESPAFGLSNPIDAQRRLGLDRQISDFQRFNIPAAASGWVGGQPRFINGLLNGTGYA